MAEYDRIVVAPGIGTGLGSPEGGVLLISPDAPGSMPLSTMQNRVLSLLNEPGPDQAYPANTSKDFPNAMITRDLNIALGTFVAETGVAPALTEKWQTLPVFPLLDYPLPQDCASLLRVEYTPNGQQTQKLIGLSQEEFDSLTGDLLPNALGQPYYYRQPFASYIRLMPQPSFGNYVGTLGGTFVLAGVPTVGDTIQATFTYLSATVNTGAYTVQVGDNLATVAFQLSQLINGSAAVQGTVAPEPFLGFSNANGQQISFTAAVNIPTTAVINYIGATTSSTMTITPFVSVLQMVPVGDTMTFFYSSYGNFLVNPGDTPGIPPLYHMALVYRVLSDYWEIKKDTAQSDRYQKKYEKLVAKAMAYKFDRDQSSQWTIAGGDDTGDWAGVGGSW